MKKFGTHILQFGGLYAVGGILLYLGIDNFEVVKQIAIIFGSLGLIAWAILGLVLLITEDDPY